MPSLLLARRLLSAFVFFCLVATQLHRAAPSADALKASGTVKLPDGSPAADAIVTSIGEPGDGIPWMAITEPDGTILATSNGPLGNIGFPSELESRRHFREMLDRTAKRITPEERDRLIQSLE